MGAFKNINDILNVPSDHLKAALRVLCSNDSEVQKTLAEYLSTLHEACAIPLLSRVDAVGTFKPSAKSAVPIPLPSEFHLCEQCGETFFDSENKHGECEYHDGECEQNENAEVWDEWEEWREGPMADADKDQCPEGFIWTCCKGDGDAEPCKAGIHKAQDKPVVCDQPENGAGVKRKREDDDADLRICERCNKTFAEGTNGDYACSYHPSPFQLNEQGAVWRTKTFGTPSPKDTLYHRVAYPDGFIYKCCNRDGTEPGCKRGPHKARNDKKVRQDAIPSQKKSQEVDDEHGEEEGSDNEGNRDEDCSDGDKNSQC